MNEDENLIVLKKSSLKKILGGIFAFIIKAYIKINKLSTLMWGVESDAIVLFLNTILFCFIAAVFRGLIAEILLVASFLNILAFLVIKMEWTQKLLK